MNHLNGLVLESLCLALQSHCNGRQIKDCFSNSQDEFILAFDDFYIKCLFYKGEIYFFSGDTPPSKSRLFKPQFTEIHENILQQIVAHPFERSFHLSISDNYQLVFKCHGRKSNILLLHNEQCIDIFKNHLEKDIEVCLADIYRPINCRFNPVAVSDINSFKHEYPYLPTDLFPLLHKSDETHFDATLAQFRSLQNIHFDPVTFDISVNPENGDFLTALNLFGAQCIKLRSFDEQRSNLITQCQQAISDKEHFIASNQKALESLKNKRPDGEIGNIILSGLHLIQPGMKSVILNDIYHNTDLPITLDPDLNGVENAEKYFKKEKALPHSLRLLESKIESAQLLLNDLRAKLSVLEKASDFKSLKPLVKQSIKDQEQEQLPYRKFDCDGFDILVGKHADSNEKLLNYYSDKNDTWLHAKDVSGSHVIIKSGKNSKVPDNVLEKAAAIAAYYSKNRKQNLVTVTYTLRKFVRKIKGAEKGKVTVSGEKTLLVKPGL